ncbi:LOW QUALITY PROTEIN: complement C3-like [Leptodactylus fuscus]
MPLGTDEDAKDKTRIFFSHIKCRENLKLEKGKDYLVYGATKNIWYTEKSGCSLITPNVLRADSEETIIVDGHGSGFDADLTIEDFPRRQFPLVNTRISVTFNNKHLGHVKLTIPSTNLEKDPNKKQYVYVTVRSPFCSLEKVVLVTFQGGYIFIQTDKPIYTPGSKVLYRTFAMTPNLKAVSKTMIIEFLTPENVIVKRDQLREDGRTGIISKSYTLPEPVTLGLWTISAKFEDNLIKYTTQFEVKEYVLPSFEIKIIPSKKFFHINDTELSVNIEATYLYGEPVYGKAFVLFGVKSDNEKKSLPDTLRRIEILEGKGLATLKREDLVKIFKEEKHMLEWSLYVSATVITDSGSDFVESELDNIFIVESPYKILYTKTSNYFMPGLTFDVMQIAAVDDPLVPVFQQLSSCPAAELAPRAMTVIVPESQQVSTAVETLTKDQQASATMVASAYNPINGNYLHIGVKRKCTPGENAVFIFTIRNKDTSVQNQIDHIHYVIINKGKIMKVGTQERAKTQAPTYMTLPITEQFIPSFRILAYYSVTTTVGKEIVADSVWVDVDDICMRTLSITGETDKDNAAKKPGAGMKLKIEADHKATVGLVAVDKGVYVINDKLKISQSKIWDSIEKYDIGCTPGSGANAAGVFYDAGLALHTNFKVSTPQRSEPLCQSNPKRRRRSSALLIQEQDKKASQYTGLEKKCCEDGMRDNPMGHNCKRRSRNILDGQKCIDAFLDCCKHITEKKESERKLKENDEDSRSSENIEYIDDAEIKSRTEFPESWLWKIEIMDGRPNPKGISTKIVPFNVKDSITTWEVLAVSLTDDKGICVSKPHNIQVMLEFFIDLKLPYSVVRNEQVEIRAILYNYAGIPLKLRVTWSYNEEICSLSTAKKTYQQEVSIKPSSSVAVPFTIVPMNLGLHDIEVKAVGQFVGDGVKKKLRVVPEGKREAFTLKSVVLDPQSRGGVQVEQISAFNATNIVPKTSIDTIVTFQGTPVSEMVEKAIDGVNLNHLIQIPSGCAEQNMMRMTAPLIACHYLDYSNQWERVGLQRRYQAIEYINNGLNRQLTYKKPDSSYGIWKENSSSTWLTAYVVKVFSLASGLVNVDRNLICDSVKWLLLNKQNPGGEFREDAHVYAKDMSGGIKRGSAELDSSLTAFVLIAMLSSEPLCTQQVAGLPRSIEKSIQYLNNNYYSLRTPYSIAITSYALAKAGRLNNIGRLMSISTDNTHWTDSGSRFLSLEATSYALLTLLKMKEFEKAGRLVKWLTEQRFYGEVYGSTQSTIMQFEALAQYLIDVPAFKDLEIDVSFKFPGRKSDTTYQLNLQNALLSRSEQTKEIGEFEITAKGRGQGTLRVFSVYQAFETEKEKNCNKFNLSVTINEEPEAKRPEGAKSTISINICTRYLMEKDATMSIIDVSMMTGYAPDVNDLRKLGVGVDRYISSFEINKDTFDRSTLIIYVDRVSHTEEECLKFNAHQNFNVGLIQPASVTIYDYYTPESRCTKFYHKDEGDKLLGLLCHGDLCRCAEGNCLMAQQTGDNFTASDRISKACEAGMDHVFKATLLERRYGKDYDQYEMHITKVFKTGTDEKAQGNSRNFTSHIKCRETLKLEEGLDYLIFGKLSDIWQTSPLSLAKIDLGVGQGDGSNGKWDGGTRTFRPSYSYVIGNNTWMEWWPNARQCQQTQYEGLCDIFHQVTEQLEMFGCYN